MASRPLRIGPPPPGSATGFLARRRPFFTGVPAWTKKLVTAGLILVLIMTVLSPPALALLIDEHGETEPGGPLPNQGELGFLAQDTPEQPTDLPEMLPSGMPTEEPEPPEATSEPPPETGEPPEGTAEPGPTETTEPPPETAEPTPEEPPGPGTGTPGPEPTGQTSPEPEETGQPVATSSPIATASPTVSSTPRATPKPARWSDSWPLGTIYIGAEEVEEPRGPIELSLDEWLSLALGLIITAVVAILGRRPLYHLLRWANSRLELGIDEPLLLQIRPLLSWWLAAVGIQVTVYWTGLQNEAARELASDFVRLWYLAVVSLTVWQLVDFAIDLYARRIAGEGQTAAIERLRPVLRRWARVLILLVSALAGLSIVQIGFSVPALLVLLVALAVGLAARDTLADIIAGFSILLDEPFRIGDRIEVHGVDGWVTVISIGLRTSVLRTRHSVEIMMPNSVISRNQVINYAYPDNLYRMQTHVGIAFGTDVERARRVMIDAVRQAQYVIADEPVEALYVEIGDSEMIFRVRWWIDFRRDCERAYDCVHTALHSALIEAGIDSPYPGQSLNLDVDDRSLAEVVQAWQAGEHPNR